MCAWVYVRLITSTSNFPFTPFTGPLNVEKHLRVVRQAIWDVRAKWYNLGVELEVKVETLEVSVDDILRLVVSLRGQYTLPS